MTQSYLLQDFLEIITGIPNAQCWHHGHQQCAARELREKLLLRWGKITKDLASPERRLGAPPDQAYGGHDHDTSDGVDWDMDDTDVSEN